MFKISVDDSKAETKLRSYAALAKKNINVAVREEAKLTAKRLMDLTPPKSKSQGAKRVSIDIGKVYLQGKFFLEVFNFTFVKFGEKVKELIRQKDASTLTKIFSRSAKLVQIHIEPFKDSIIKRFRKDGRVPKNVKPLSLPLNAESARKAYEDKKKKLVGLVKSGWANCFKMLGGNLPSWLSHSGTGRAIIKEDSVMLVNSVSYADELDRKKKIVANAISGRKRDLAKKIDRLLKQSKK
jgi:hypothetical protein